MVIKTDIAQRLDQLIFAHYGRVTSSLLQQALTDNPDLPLIIPAGSSIILNDAPPTETTQPTIQLWD